MADTAPVISIGVPVFNGEPYLTDTLHSLLNQDEPRLEVLVSDNGSTDGTESICRQLAEQDPRLFYERSEVNRGAAWNYNHVLAKAAAPWFKWAAADDLCAPTFVRRCLEAIRDAADGTVLAYPQTLLIDEHGAEIGTFDDSNLDLRDDEPSARLERLLRNRFEWHPIFGVIRTDVLRETRGIGPFPLADTVTLAEVCMRGRFVQVAEPLFLRRYHDRRSLVAGPSFVEQVAWYDPQRQPKMAFPQARVSRELVAGVGRAPLSASEKARCCGVVLRRWTAPHWRHIGGEVKIACLSTLQRARQNSSS
jgi:glycosyltransferase involved in cell wall biosynthesis